MSIATCW
nr:unnamed protein product [Callosobruchus analis]